MFLALFTTRLLNNREVDTVVQSKADFNGTNPENSSGKEDKDDEDGLSKASTEKSETGAFTNGRGFT